MDVIKGIIGNDDQSIFQECIRGQRATMREYLNKLKSPLPAGIKELLKHHLVKLEKSLSTMRMKEMAQ